jgi:hypothetical protein
MMLAYYKSAKYFYIVIASDQWERGNLGLERGDCFVVSLLAMTLSLMRLY